MHFLLTSNFNGYEAKKDITNIPAGILVVGSQNVQITDGERIASRKGYKLLGATNTGSTGIVSSYEWNNHRGQQFALRSYSTKLQFLYSGTWRDLATGFTSVAFNFAEFWDNTQKQDVLLFVNGDNTIREWNGAVGLIASSTATTITKSGTTTWAQEGFNSTGSLTINGNTYTYTGGSATTTLTGVNVTPVGEAVGSLVFQPIIVSTKSFGTYYTNDLISVLYNQVYIGCLTDRQAYVSKINLYKGATDFDFSTPRLPGEGAILTFDGSAVAFDPQEEYMSIHAGQDQIYKTIFSLSADNARETLVVQRLKTSTQKAARSQAAIAKVINDSVFVTNEPTMDSLGRVEQISTPQTKPLSDPIKTNFDSYNFTGVHAKYYRNNIYIALPVEGLVLIRNLEKGWWEAPQTLPISRLAIVGSRLIGHSSQSNESYTLFEGYNDNGAPIRAIAAFSYMNFGSRTKYKDFTEFFTEGYITLNTDLNLVLNYEYGGFDQQLTKLIDGADLDLIFSGTEDDSLGTHTLGEVSLGGGGGIISVLPPKFRAIRTEPPRDFFEMQPIYISDGVDQQWELLAMGPKISISMAEATTLKD